MRTVRLTTCNTSFEAHVLKNALETEGIAAALHNENMTNLYGGLISAFTGVDIFVFEDDLEHAQQVLEQQTQNDKFSD